MGLPGASTPNRRPLALRQSHDIEDDAIAWRFMARIQQRLDFIEVAPAVTGLQGGATFMNAVEMFIR